MPYFLCVKGLNAQPTSIPWLCPLKQPLRVSQGDVSGHKLFAFKLSQLNYLSQSVG